MKLLVLDVDGVLLPKYTVFLDPKSDACPFDSRDTAALSKVLQLRIPVLILSGGNSNVVKRHLSNLGIQSIRQALTDKFAALQDELLVFPELDLKDVAYVGDGENDMECLLRVGFPICPADADVQVQSLARYVCTRDGGRGAVAEAIDWMMHSQA